MEAEKQQANKTPEEKLAIAKIQVMMEDSFGLLSSTYTSLATKDKARNWFETSDCALWCDMAGTTHDRVKKLFGILTERFNSGKINKEELRLGIRRLEKKL